MILVLYKEIENREEATDKVFRDLEAKAKVRMKHLKANMTRIS